MSQPTLDAVAALWRAGLAAGDPAPRVLLGQLAVERLRAELPGVPSRAVPGLVGLPGACCLRLAPALPADAVRLEPQSGVVADSGPDVDVRELPEALTHRASLPPFRWQDVLQAMPPATPPRPTGIPHPLDGPLAAVCEKESPTSANDVGPTPQRTSRTERVGD